MANNRNAPRKADTGAQDKHQASERQTRDDQTHGAQGPESQTAGRETAEHDTGPHKHTRRSRPAAHRLHQRGEPKTTPVPVPPPQEDVEGEGPPSPIPMPMGTKELDSLVHANLGRLTANLSPASLGMAYADWAIHLAEAPGKQMELGIKAARKNWRFATHAAKYLTNPRCEPCIEPLARDNRFDADAWRRWPYSLIYQSFLLTQQWWHNATTDVRGVSDSHENRVTFGARQLLDLWSPSNFPWTNPEVLQTTVEQGGTNLLRGMENLLEDTKRRITEQPPAGAENFRPGKEVAVTPGKVVYRNRLIELIQYEPTTGTVHPEPVLIVPAWIMKYYILDLSPHNSMIRYLRDQGHTVFCISWRNPGEEDREVSMDDYRRMGPQAALQTVRAIVPDRKVHAVGYCIGGTLLSIEAARMARDGEEDQLASMTLLAAQVDFTEAGELQLFIDESEVSYLEDIMWAQGFLDTKQMAGAFQMLRSNDLIWSRMIKEYMLGERQEIFDLMAWNADGTRLPYRMHSEYLRQLFLKNDLANGRYEVDNRPVALTDIRVPIFAVGTEKDHVAPWPSAYKIQLLTDTDITFALTRGGHNAGIISPPDHPRRHYRVHETKADDPYRDPDTWLAIAAFKEGSWWEEWQAWLAAHSGRRVQPPQLGNADAGYPPLMDAPGSYVHQQ